MQDLLRRTLTPADVIIDSDAAIRLVALAITPVCVISDAVIRLVALAATPEDLISDVIIS